MCSNGWNRCWMDTSKHRRLRLGSSGKLRSLGCEPVLKHSSSILSRNPAVEKWGWISGLWWRSLGSLLFSKVKRYQYLWISQKLRRCSQCPFCCQTLGICHRERRKGKLCGNYLRRWFFRRIFSFSDPIDKCLLDLQLCTNTNHLEQKLRCYSFRSFLGWKVVFSISRTKYELLQFR